MTANPGLETDVIQGFVLEYLQITFVCERMCLSSFLTIQCVSLYFYFDYLVRMELYGKHLLGSLLMFIYLKNIGRKERKCE